jgi:hypothetical protein
MSKLIGYAYQTGVVEFESKENPWAFRMMEGELKAGQEHRIRFDPSIAPVEIRPSPNAPKDSMPWLESFAHRVQTASVVYLHRSESILRFRQAIHHLSPDRNLITIGSQAELQEFMDERMAMAQTLYAMRHGAFQFDIDKVIIRERDQEKSFQTMDLVCRVKTHHPAGEVQLGFDATGSNSHAELMQWRTSMKEGEVGKFSMTENRIRLVVINYIHPLTLCEEFHRETKCRWYLFSPETVKTWLERVKKIKHA